MRFLTFYETLLGLCVTYRINYCYNDRVDKQKPVNGAINTPNDRLVINAMSNVLDQTVKIYNIVISYRSSTPTRYPSVPDTHKTNPPLLKPSDSNNRTGLAG